MTGETAAHGTGDDRVAVLTRLLPLACIVAAACLLASELMTTFEYTPPGAEALLEQDGADRHGNALAVIAIFAIVGVIVAVLTASRPVAMAVAVAGGLALLIFLIADVPDANAVGTLDDPRQSYFSAEAVPREGFWLALISTVALTVTGIALATLSSEQLAALRPGGGKRPRASEEPRRAADERPARSGTSAHDAAERKSALGRVRRPRPRQRG